MLTLGEAGWRVCENSRYYPCNTSEYKFLQKFRKVSFKPEFLEQPTRSHMRPVIISLTSFPVLCPLITLHQPHSVSPPPQDLCTGCPCFWTSLAWAIPMAHSSLSNFVSNVTISKTIYQQFQALPSTARSSCSVLSLVVLILWTFSAMFLFIIWLLVTFLLH